MRFRNVLVLPMLVIALILSAGNVGALPQITIFDVKTTSETGILDRDFRIGEKVTYKIGYRFSASQPDPRKVTGTVRIEFADGSCERTYQKEVLGVNPDEDRWLRFRRRVPACADVGQWIMVTYSIQVGVSVESATGAIFIYPPLEPIARFTARPRYGEKPLRVYFTNKSLGTVDTFDWDFGGDPLGVLDPHSPDHSPIYTYKTPGTYSVTLSITGPDGSDSKTKTDYITVVDPATVLDANFRAPRSQRSVLWEDTPVTVDFEDRSIGTPDAWEWDFSYDEDDGFNVESTNQNPSYVYTAAGMYSVALKVYDSANSLEDEKVKLNYIVIYEP